MGSDGFLDDDARTMNESFESNQGEERKLDKTNEINTCLLRHTDVFSLLTTYLQQVR